MDRLMHANAAFVRPTPTPAEQREKEQEERMDLTLEGGTLSGIPTRPEGLQFRMTIKELPDGPEREEEAEAESPE